MMSGQCSHFVQNAWKKELCSNCFKSKEEHGNDVARFNTSRTFTNVPVTNHKVQGILRIKESCHVRLRKKNVAFPDCLSEVIGYGGDDFSDLEDDSYDGRTSNQDDEVPDSEEERALNNLTRTNTNFNTVTANLNGTTTTAAAPTTEIEVNKSTTLMLGKVQKDADGRKKTLLVSVKPFGGDDSLPTAKRPADRTYKSPVSLVKKYNDAVEDLLKTDTCLSKSKELTLEKIVDMPLITSTSKVTKEPRPSNGDLELRSEKKVCLTRAQPLSKKSDPEKPKVQIQNSYTPKSEFSLNGDCENSASFDSGIELTLSPLKVEEDKPEEFKVEEAQANKFNFESSREMAGEPDGKADEEVIEGVESPLLSMESKIGVEPRTSFLHSETKVKPTVPLKPKVAPKCPEEHARSPSLDKPLEQPKRSPEAKVMFKGEGDKEPEEDVSPLTSKRRMAPKPPVEDANLSLFTRNTVPTNKSDSPVIREKEKRERASSSSSSPKFRKEPDPSVKLPEPAPRRNISLSSDSLNAEKSEEKSKKHRSKFSLKKFLRVGTAKKDVDVTVSVMGDEVHSVPQPKPRLEIIHPSELDGNTVQVLGSEKSEDVVDSRNEATASVSVGRPSKPPPPPRTQSLEDWPRLEPGSRPVRPPPPRVETKVQPRSEKSSSKSWQPSAEVASDSIYANLAEEAVTGQVRSTLAPSKPQRTASMRDQTITQPVVKKRIALSQNYDGLGSPIADSPASSEQAYDCLSSSPECDSSLALRHGNEHRLHHKKKQSDSSAIEPNGQFKYHSTFTRSTSLPYCSSETESELYAPYNFYTGDEGPEDDQDWKNKTDESKVSCFRQRRGRGIVHRSLEDNYGAVVVANHEALAQFLEQLNQQTNQSVSLRGLKTANPRLRDFNLESTNAVPVGRRIFYPASWNEQSVTMCVSFDATMHDPNKEFYLEPVIEFIDAVPSEIHETINYRGRQSEEATISIFPRLQVSTIQSFGSTKKDLKDESTVRECSFVLLQFVSALKSLQARGIEDAPKNLSSVVLCRDDKDACYRLYLLQRLNDNDVQEQTVSLCQCALLALEQLHLSSQFPLIRDLLMKEKAVTLSQVKSVLEFSLWGPADVTLGGSRERELVLQRWLDLERATVLHALIRTKTPFAVTDEYQLLFLVRTSAKILCEASFHLDRQRSAILNCTN